MQQRPYPTPDIPQWVTCHHAFSFLHASLTPFSLHTFPHNAKSCSNVRALYKYHSLCDHFSRAKFHHPVSPIT